MRQRGIIIEGCGCLGCNDEEDNDGGNGDEVSVKPIYMRVYGRGRGKGGVAQIRMGVKEGGREGSSLKREGRCAKASERWYESIERTGIEGEQTFTKKIIKM